MEDHAPIHTWFGLSYASYLVLPRTILQSCSAETQKALVEALNKVGAEYDKNMIEEAWPGSATIHVTLRDNATNRFTKDPLADYQRGRRRLWQQPSPP